MKGFVGTVVGGAVGLAALYVVGRIAFQAGHDIAEVECRYEQLRKKTEQKKSEVPDKDATEEIDEEQEETNEFAVTEKPKSKIGMLFGIGKLLSKKGNGSVVGDLIQNPENHVIEASVRGREIHVNVKPRMA